MSADTLEIQTIRHLLEAKAGSVSSLLPSPEGHPPCLVLTSPDLLCLFPSSLGEPLGLLQ